MERFFKRPWIVVAVIAAITVFFALQLPRAQLDNNNFRFVPDDNPARLEMKRVDEVFGSQVYIIVGLERSHGTILDADFLTRLRSFETAVEELPIVGDATSLATADYIGGGAEGITVEPLVPEGFSGTAAEIAAVKDRLLEWDMYRRALVSDDFRSTQILVSLDSDSEKAGAPEAVAAYRDVRNLAEAAGFRDTKIYMTGVPVFSSVINEAMKSDLVFLIPLVVVVVFFTLFMSFRRIGGIALPILTVAVSAIWAIGAMTLLGYKLSILSTVLPVILVAVGSAYCIHVISHYYDEMAGKRFVSGEEHRQILFSVLRKFGKPVFLAAFTDATGFLALCFTSVVPIYEFGMFATFGILVAFMVAVTLIPALLIIRGPARPAAKEGAAEGAGEGAAPRDRLSEAIADLFCAIARKPRTVVAAAIAVAIFSIAGVSRLVIDNVLVEYFKKDTEIVRSDEYIRDYFGGSKTVSLVVRGEKPGDVLRPDVLGAMDGLTAYLAAEVPEVGKTTGFTDLVKRINQVLNADESPDGLARPAAAAPAEPGFGFGQVGAGESAEPGFGFDAGEPSFGFGFAEDGSAGAAGRGAEAEPAVARPSPAAQAVDGAALARLLSEALAKAERRDLSAEELVASLSRSLNYRGAAYYEIPTDPARYAKKDQAELQALIANYLVLLSGDISSFADDPLEPRAVRMNIQMRTVGQVDTDRAIGEIRGYVASRFPADVKVEIAGPALVEGSLNKLVVNSQLSSLPISLLFVFATLAVFYRSGWAGLIGIAPLCVSILINFGVMGAFGIKLNIGTALVASVAIGIGIDYMIHYMAAYHREFLKHTSKGEFLRHTYLTSGKAIIFNAASVGLGFAVLAFSRFNILAELGILLALTMATSALVSLTVLPVLLTLVNPAFIRRPLPSDKAESETEEGK